MGFRDCGIINEMNDGALAKSSFARFCNRVHRLIAPEPTTSNCPSRRYRKCVRAAVLYFPVVLLLLLAAVPVQAHNGTLALAYPMPSIHIDGDLSDWPVSPLYPLEAFAHNSPRDSTDFRGRFRVGYNIAENAVFVGLEVEDDTTTLELPGSPIRDNGGFALSPLHTPGRAEQFGIAGSPPFFAFRAKTVEKRFVEFAVRRIDGHHTYEWKLDVAGIGVARIKPGEAWSLAVALCDVDGQEARRFSVIGWGEQPWGHADNLIGDLLLVPDIDPVGELRGKMTWLDETDEAPPRQVSIEPESDSSFHIRLNTDDHGRFVARLPPSTYRVDADDFRVESGNPVSVRVMADAAVSLGPQAVKRVQPSDYFAAPVDMARIHRGVCWVAGGDDLTEHHMLPLVRCGVEWISQTTFGWQTRHNSTKIRFRPNSGEGESDRGLAETSRLAKKFGIRTMLKPHIWLTRSGDKWRSDIAMDSEEDWQAWFDQYRTFILHYAKLADDERIDVLCIGTELHRTAVEREADWRRLIAEIRAIYHGKLIYAANWYKEFEEVSFWDDLDYIGIQAYFPLMEEDRYVKESGKESVPTVADLRRGWEKHMLSIERIHDKFQKPVIITEIGYHSMIDAAERPWEWEISDVRASIEEGLQTQANCYEAFFETFWEKDLFAGVYFWKWHPYYRDAGGVRNRDFTPQNKPAEQTMRRWYGM